MNDVGIMQGRLSPPVAGRLQAFPWKSWEVEFDHARACGFGVIEWLFEAEGYGENPIWTERGREKIRLQIDRTGVQVRTLCAAYFMVHPFFRVSEDERIQSIEVLNNLLLRAASVGVRVILLPVLEASEIRTEAEQAQLIDCLKEPLRLATAHGIRLGLETELPASEYRDLIERVSHSALGVYYDAGNATAKGYDIAADIRALSPSLCGVHIKDRKRNGPNILLGHGDADFSTFFDALVEVGYVGPLILETAFGGDVKGDAEAQLNFVMERLVAAGGRSPRTRVTLHDANAGTGEFGK